MLVLTRRINESIIMDVGDVQILVKVVQVKGKQIRLGFECPKHVKVHRQELMGNLKESFK